MKTSKFQERVFLAGFMGSGKSHIGKKLATELGWKFIDLDDCVIKEFGGLPIPQIFVQHNEEAFRRMEEKCLKEMLHQNKVIIALGGGTPCFYRNMDWILENGLSVFLKTSLSLSLQRLEPQTAQRPLLAGKTGDELRSLIQERTEARLNDYERANWIYFQTHNSSDIIEQLADRLKVTFGI